MLNTSKKIVALRKLLIKNKVDYYLISHSDEYQNEFLPIYSKRLEWISDFTGSAGDVIIGKNEAYLFVDGRYTIQAQNEVSKKHYKIYNYSKLTPLNLLRSKKARNVGFEGDIQPYFKIKSYAKSLGK
ncbi:aminopeptidase P family N-terminal domain-containing protein, partial [Pelagibacteraceae bacterium]|nr:aminopeptidase P family N-terminal domain-containing protein [Pelagibacteraceae bacterium]